MNDLRIFENSEFGRLEVYEIGGKPYFPATKCAEILGYSNPRQAVIDHCKGVTKYDSLTGGGKQTINLIPEGDLYRLIIRSNMPKAQEFESWVFDVILPQIRQTGSYTIKPPTPTEALLQAVQILADQEHKLAEQQKQLTVLHHRVNNLDAINATGDRRQLLNKMVQRMAHDKGITFAQAWKHFDEAFNFSYRANLTARRNNYAEAHNMREIARPDYLERVGQIEDAIRVMDKLLNGAGRQLA